MTEHEDISKPGDECTKTDNKPDDEMMKLLLERIECNLPWNQFKLETLKDCAMESEFQKYFDAIIELHDTFLKIPPKCHHRTWTYSQFMENLIESNTSVAIDFAAYDGKVSTVKFRITARAVNRNFTVHRT